MSDYTIEELQSMLSQKQDEEHEAEQLAYQSSSFYFFEQQMLMTIKSSDYEMVSHTTTGSFQTMIARVHKSETLNKQYIEIPHYWNETRDGELVARAKTSCSFSSGSYGESYTTPTLQILGTRVKDLTILKS